MSNISQKLGTLGIFVMSTLQMLRTNLECTFSIQLLNLSYTTNRIISSLELHLFLQSISPSEWFVAGRSTVTICFSRSQRTHFAARGWSCRQARIRGALLIEITSDSGY